MKRRLLLSLIAALVLALSMAYVWSKAHVPTAKAQVCHKGKVRTVSTADVQDHQGHGDCQLPACDFNNIFRSGPRNSCPAVDADGDGRYDLPNPRDEAVGTPGCPAGTF